MWKVHAAEASNWYVATKSKLDRPAASHVVDVSQQRITLVLDEKADLTRLLYEFRDIGQLAANDHRGAIRVEARIAALDDALSQSLSWIALLKGKNEKETAFCVKLETRPSLVQTGSRRVWHIPIYHLDLSPSDRVFFSIQFNSGSGSYTIEEFFSEYVSNPLANAVSENDQSSTFESPAQELPPRAAPALGPFKTVSTPDLVYRFESFSNAVIRGWAAVPDNPDAVVKLDVFNAQEFLFSVLANQPRSDLRRANIARLGGFTIDLSPLLEYVEFSNVEITFGSKGVKLDPVFEISNKLANDFIGRRSQNLRSPDRRGISIIIPVYNALADLEQCLQSIYKYTSTRVRCLIVDDASPDQEVSRYLSSRYVTDRVTVHRNAQNLGFSGSINVALQLAGGDDVIVLNSDTRVTKNWWSNLQAAAYSSSDIGSATPLSNNAGAFSIEPPRSGWVDDWTDDDFARLVKQSSRLIRPETPTMHGFCVYLKCTMLNEIGVFDHEAFPRGYGEENDLSMRARYRGWRHIVDDRTYVYHSRGSSFGEERGHLYTAGRKVVDDRYPEYKRLITKFSSSPEMLSVKHLIRIHAHGMRDCGLSLRPRVMFVINTRTGGTPQTNRDLMKEVIGYFEPYVLLCDSQKITLIRFNSDFSEDEVCDHLLRSPIEMIDHRSTEYDNVITQWLTDYAIELIHVRHIGRHGLGLIDVAGDLSIPVVFSFHDFYVICPTVKLLDGALTYCAGRCVGASDPCKPDLWKETHVPPLRDRWVKNWRAILEPVLRKCDVFITTDGGARDLISQYFPWMARDRFQLIEHGRDFPEMLSVSPAVERDKPLKVLVPGNISKAKGAQIILDIIGMCKADEIEFHILGDVDKSLRYAGAHIHGVYGREEFAERVRRISPHVGAIFSIWPETFSHTLSEMWSVGLPVVAFNLGAVGDRIAKNRGGWLLDECDARAAYEMLLSIRSAKGMHEDAVAEVAAWQNGIGRTYGAKDMAERYMRIYRQLLKQ